MSFWGNASFIVPALVYSDAIASPWQYHRQSWPWGWRCQSCHCQFVFIFNSNSQPQDNVIDWFSPSSVSVTDLFCDDTVWVPMCVTGSVSLAHRPVPRRISDTDCQLAAVRAPPAVCKIAHLFCLRQPSPQFSPCRKYFFCLVKLYDTSVACWQRRAVLGVRVSVSRHLLGYLVVTEHCWFSHWRPC